jgi:hypothetical protein
VKVGGRFRAEKYFLLTANSVGRMNEFYWRGGEDSKKLVFEDRVKVAIHAGCTSSE